MEFQEATLRHGEDLLRAGADIVKVPVEIDSLSFTHRDEFAKYGAMGTPVIDDVHHMSLYFFGESALRLFRKHAINTLTIIREIRRSELPERRGSPVPLGSHAWERCA